MGLMSKRKGAVAERELSAELRRIGFTDARRGQQYHGGPDSPDVVGVEGCHLEAKRCEALRLYEALDQAVSEAPIGSVPVVAHRRNRRPWVLILHLDHSVSFACRLLLGLGYRVIPPHRTSLGGYPVHGEDGKALGVEWEARA